MVKKDERKGKRPSGANGLSKKERRLLKTMGIGGKTARPRTDQEKAQQQEVLAQGTIDRQLAGCPGLSEVLAVIDESVTAQERLGFLLNPQPEFSSMSPLVWLARGARRKPDRVIAMARQLHIMP